jgi:[methyl-Co(III) methanol-specific corrinoid protein]:coenzyme M methyltransferase
MIEKMEEINPLLRLMKKFKKGARPVTHMGPFLPLVRIRERRLPFNDIMRNSQAMTEAALMSFELGFESTVLPFDLNVEAEMLGARVRYHDGFDGNPVYPTITDKPFAPGDDIAIPDNLADQGRMPAILKTIGTLKEHARDKGAVGVFVPGPFTLAGQVLDMDALYVMLLKQPGKAMRLFEQLTTFINQLIHLYVHAGADFMTIVEGGGASIAPKTFRNLLLPSIQHILKPKKIPQIAYFFGSSSEIIEFMLTCNIDGIILDKKFDIKKTRRLVPETIPLFGQCGGFDMLANATPAEITDKVHHDLDLGFTTVCPPADIYPPARIENIEAFVRALQDYEK